MKRLKWLIVLFCLALSIPLTYVIWHSYQSLAQEERAQLRFFSEALFDEIEKEMAYLVQQEENRAVDEYHYTLVENNGKTKQSPLSKPPGYDYILGYLQNNPDGSFQTPLVSDLGQVPESLRKTISQLKETNTIFNSKKFAISQKPSFPKPAVTEKKAPLTVKKDKDAFAERYISKTPQQTAKSYLGRQSFRKEKITASQARNLSKEDQSIVQSDNRLSESASPPAAQLNDTHGSGWIQSTEQESVSDRQKDETPIARPASEAFQVEFAPLQSIFILSGRFFIFRRIAINNQIFRQGFVLKVEPFLQYLVATHFNTQPMAAFTSLHLEVMENGQPIEVTRSDPLSNGGELITQRTFPAPFDFISAAVLASAIPPSPARQTLNMALIVLGIVMLLGLVAIYQSAHTVVELSERRSQFVSSVTHELKTPLTNIRMYIEMLEQGIAATPEREQEYLQILESESARLSRLINNVLELSKLEKKQRHFKLVEGQLDTALAEVQAILQPKLEQEGFELAIENSDQTIFAFDREVMIQILINLIENSIKFGRTAIAKRITIKIGVQDNFVRITVADTGPGIPRQALKKVFDDFYRVDNDLTRTTGGTGIGLALVKRFVSAMGGRVEAANNDNAGCTITLFLPKSHK